LKDLQLDRQQFTRRRGGCDGSGGGRFGCRQRRQLGGRCGDEGRRGGRDVSVGRRKRARHEHAGEAKIFVIRRTACDGVAADMPVIIRLRSLPALSGNLNEK
jgi:hypothetical protein